MRQVPAVPAKGIGKLAALACLISTSGTCCSSMPRQPQVVSTLADAAQTLQLRQGDDGKSFDLREGSRVRLALDENPSTGYKWKICSPPGAVIEKVSDTFISNGTAPGVGGVREFVFVVQGPGKATLALKYMRSWEGEAAAVSSFRAVLNCR